MVGLNWRKVAAIAVVVATCAPPAWWFAWSWHSVIAWDTLTDGQRVGTVFGVVTSGLCVIAAVVSGVVEPDAWLRRWLRQPLRKPGPRHGKPSTF